MIIAHEEYKEEKHVSLKVKSLISNSRKRSELVLVYVTVVNVSQISIQ